MWGVTTNKDPCFLGFFLVKDFLLSEHLLRASASSGFSHVSIKGGSVSPVLHRENTEAVFPMMTKSVAELGSEPIVPESKDSALSLLPAAWQTTQTGSLESLKPQNQALLFLSVQRVNSWT